MSRVAFVTGGAGAIGSAICEALGDQGYEVAVIDQTGEFACDLGESREVERVAEAALGRFGRCDALVHAAASFEFFALDQLDLERWRRVQAVNVEAALLLCRALAPGMTERKFGRVVFITSNTVWSPPGPQFLAYIASKAALEGIARVLAMSLGAAGVTVNTVEPGLTRVARTEADTPPQAFAAARAAQAIPRNVEAPQVADAVAFLCSDAAAAITGQALCVDNGLVLR